MIRTVLAGVLASGALLGAGGAQAQGYGYGYGGAPAYVSGGYNYAPYQRRGFPLLGARAGVTVLGIDLDADASLRIGASGWGGGGHHQPVYAPPVQAYAPPPPPPVYSQPYPQSYVQPSFGWSAGYSGGYGYGGGYCGC